MFQIAKRKIGYGYTPIISAELSVNHLGNIDTALQMIEEVAKTGAQAVKIQFFKADDFKDEVSEAIYNLYKQYEIDLPFVIACYEKAKECGLIFGITTTSIEGVKLVANYTDYFKIASDQIKKISMINEMASYDIPVIASAGHLRLGELKDYNPDLWLICESQYPCKNPKLWKIKHMQEMGYTVGYSSHSNNIDDCIRATELGAIWIEKHFTIRENVPDSEFSIYPQELKQLVEAIK